ncbi:MAG: leucine-rich repeat protein [bacterium]|nr:leucine-rich repeat protein [bacterium]
MSDLEIIKQLEKRLGTKLKRLPVDEVYGDQSYAVSEDDSERVTALSLCKCKLDDLTPLAGLRALTDLHLIDNHVSDLTPLADLHSLTYLRLSNNHVSDISPLGGLYALTMLYLKDNQVSDIVPLAGLRALTDLYLYNNQVSDLSPLARLHQLTMLYLSNNQVSDLTPLAGLQALTYLRLNNNRVSDISPLAGLQALTDLELNGNQVMDLTPLARLQALTDLELNDNHVRDISSLSGLQSLETLYLNNNQVSGIFPLSGFPALETLYLDNNQVTDLSPLTGLKSLERVNLRRNNLTSLPPGAGRWNMAVKWEFDFSKGIYLAGNPLERPPVEIVKKGNKAINDWFDVLGDASQTKTLNEAKILLVGDGAAGKTSLVNRITGNSFNPSETKTNGIIIKSWPLPANPTITANIWDFGGQEIMHATHQFFLTKRSLYIVVLDARKDENAEYWLQHVNSFGGNSPVIVVLNKMDQHPGHRLNRRFLQKKYPHITGFFRISCASGEGIPALLNHLTGRLQNLELIHTIWPLPWFNIKATLENMREELKLPYISKERYDALCHDQDIDTTSGRDTLVGYLNDLGVVVHHKDFTLKETHVLDPQWVTSAVYKIINSREVIESGGLLDPARLRHILGADTTTAGETEAGQCANGYGYPTHTHLFIIEMMQKFQLCYEMEDGRLLLPDLLPKEQPELDWPEQEDNLCFRLDYDFLPPSVLPRFIIKMHCDIVGSKRWRTGVLLEDDNFHCAALVIADTVANRIHIEISGKQKRDYFAALLYELRRINDSFEKLKVNELVTMPDDHDITVPLDHLLYLESIGTTTFIPYAARKHYSVKELLGAVKVSVETGNEEEMLSILKKVAEAVDTEESLTEKTASVFELKPNIAGVGLNINQIISNVSAWLSKGKEEQE